MAAEAEVAEWLGAVGLSALAPILSERGVATKASLLELLDESAMSTEDQLFFIGITKMEERASLLAALKDLAKAEPLMLQAMHSRTTAAPAASISGNTTAVPPSGLDQLDEAAVFRWLEESSLPKAARAPVPCSKVAIFGVDIADVA